jgi:hypothetical protein
VLKEGAVVIYSGEVKWIEKEKFSPHDEWAFVHQADWNRGGWGRIGQALILLLPRGTSL